MIEGEAARVVDTLAGGGVAIFPTDVGYAIVGTTEAAIGRIFAYKNRSFTKACGMFSSWEMFLDIALVGPREREAVDTVIHGYGLPISVVVPYRTDHPHFAALSPLARERSSRGGTIDMLLNAGSLHTAIASLSFARAQPVLGSSANRSLSGSKYRMGDVEAEVCRGADLLVDGGPTRYRHPEGMGSTIIELPGFRPLRRGILFDEICAILHRHFRTDPRRFAGHGHNGVSQEGHGGHAS